MNVGYATRVALYTVLLLGLSSAFAQTPPAKKKSRKPASTPDLSHVTTAKTSVPLLPDGTPDYSKFPNPFVVKKWTLDLGATSGSETANGTYNEFNLGVNAYFYNWPAWRNVAFYRPAFNGPGTQLYGVDTSERMSYEFSRSSGLALFAAPGFRLAGSNQAAPFAEAGITFRIVGVTFSGGARELLGSWIQTGGTNETQFFISLSLAGRP